MSTSFKIFLGCFFFYSLVTILCLLGSGMWMGSQGLYSAFGAGAAQSATVSSGFTLPWVAFKSAPGVFQSIWIMMSWGYPVLTTGFLEIIRDALLYPLSAAMFISFAISMWGLMTGAGG